MDQKTADQQRGEPAHEIHRLVGAYLDGQLDEDQWAFLAAKEGDEEFWSEWQDILLTETALQVGLQPAGEVIPLPVKRGGPRRWLPMVAAGIAACVAVWLGVGLLRDDPPGGSSPGATTVERGGILVSSLVNCRWETEADRIHAGDELLGRKIKLRSGTMKIRFASGRVVVLNGQVDATFQEGQSNTTILKLDRGAVAVLGGEHDVPAAQGFFVQTPRGLIEEIGTEFVVQVGEDVSITVESGRVEVQGEKTGEELLVLNARQSALLSNSGTTREDRSFNLEERRLFDLMPEVEAGAANVVHYDPAIMGAEIWKIVSPDSLLLVKERENVRLEIDRGYNIDQPGTYAFYRRGEEHRPEGWTMPGTEKKDVGLHIDSYLIQFNPSVPQLEDIQVYGYIEFDRPVHGLLTGGSRLHTWDSVVGLPFTSYWSPTWWNSDLVRGLESTSLSGGVANIADVITLSEDRKRLTVRLCASLRLDHIRVILKSESQ